jgi:nucleotidyltransferase-like protein
MDHTLIASLSKLEGIVAAMTVDQYLQNILIREAVDTGPYSPVRGVQAIIEPVIREWSADRLVAVSPSGSFAKGTANRSSTDIDLFISLSEYTSEPLKEIYNKLHRWMRERSYGPSPQNVSIRVNVAGYKVDLVPAKRQGGYGDDHSIYRRRADTWSKTNVTAHVNHVVRSGRQQEIRLVKLWRDQKGLDFPSFYLELSVINALSSGQVGTLGSQVWTVFEYLRDWFGTARVVDPANTNNVVSDDLTSTERAKVVAAAARTLAARDWNEIVR